ncbi:metal-binding protein ZinT [Carnobacterium divergens]|uniref:ZinT/AdcA family metal-binding protein n=1 Tax=Carnobacterium divergens TaxID=2748 RepID=UPI001071EAA0|nr:ZinT/AdcA family metal-binding protein [Carnobacterium divergens]TFJ40684.1 metal-binding protein ZinT [Carnobacterium divergens]TFJ49372.1 metal-binding protein ZinT [Carnobacterium divergens]TFJ54739.1 metal-binding protein ZinT [Carnobacterium divergens]TFJ60950.1 metal-binding protein ZinT [Carnobacterium divergens]TFJ71090.1 metal-binding protein ZinT [Carnobacterium divergens]
MKKKMALVLVMIVAIVSTGCIKNEKTKKTETSSSQLEKKETETHSHHHATKASEGIFEDNEVKERSISDWQGSWKSIYPYLVDGSLDEVFKEKAKTGDKTVDEYKKYYESDIEAIDVYNNKMAYLVNGEWQEAEYESAGYQILTYESGKKGVRYLFTSKTEETQAPKYVQFSDHLIEPHKSSHFHIYMGNESHEALLTEMTNWPTFFPSKMSKKEIIHDMLYH